MFKRIFSLTLCLAVFLVSLPFCASALSENELTAPSAILIEAKTGKVLFEKNSHEKRACASITKVMTLLLVMEAIEDDKIKLTDTLTSSAHAASMGGSDIWLEEGEKMTVDDLIKATAVASANDAAVVLAEAISGSEDSFVAEMNERAKELNMKETTFKNCNGLDEEGHLTSAYDVAIMSAELIKYDKIFDYTSIWLDYLRDGKTQIVNTNKLLRTYSGITGLKTGTTNDAGCCMSATAQRDGLSLVAVVLGCGTGTERFADSAKLLDFGFANYRTETLVLPEQAKGWCKVKGGMEVLIEIQCEEPGSVILEKSKKDEIIGECILKKEIKAPVNVGDILGEVVYYAGDTEIKKCIITAKSSAEKMSFKSVMKKIFNSLFAL